MSELKRDTKMPDFFMCPKFILQHHLSGTAICVYMLLYERARLSQKNDKWIDQDGHVFEIYPVNELMRNLGRTRRCIQVALRELEGAGLIRRECVSVGEANRIFILMHNEGAQFIAQGERTFPRRGSADSCASPAHIYAQEGRTNMRTSNNNRVINTELYKMSNTGGSRCYGKYANICLTDEEYAELKSAIPDLDILIEKMSAYLATTGKSYQNYAAALNSWAAREPRSYRDKKYECNPDESL